MTYQEFRDKYNGRWLDYDGSYGNQCWDLAQYYFTECLNLPDTILSGCGLVSNMLYSPKRQELDQYFEEISTNNMHAGDVCIWEYGHIAIYDHWDESGVYFFSQNPNPCEVMIIGMGGMHAFKLKENISITPNVEKDETKNQIEVLVPELRVRTEPNLNGQVLGFASIGYYDYFETVDSDGYKWYKIADKNWIASNDEWTTVYPKKEDEYVSFKVLNNKDGYKEIDLGKIFIK